MLFHYVDNEESARQTAQVSDRAEVLLELSTLASDLKELALRQVRECTVVHQLVDVRHFLHSLANGGEVGKHTAGPTLDNVRHIYACCLLSNNVLSLFFSSDEQDLLALLGNLLQSLCSLVNLGYGFVQIDDVDAIALHEDIGCHGGVPFATEVTEVATCLE